MPIDRKSVPIDSTNVSPVIDNTFVKVIPEKILSAQGLHPMSPPITKLESTYDYNSTEGYIPFSLGSTSKIIHYASMIGKFLTISVNGKKPFVITSILFCINDYAYGKTQRGSQIVFGKYDIDGSRYGPISSMIENTHPSHIELLGFGSNESRIPQTLVSSTTDGTGHISFYINLQPTNALIGQPYDVEIPVNGIRVSGFKNASDTISLLTTLTDFPIDPKSF